MAVHLVITSESVEFTMVVHLVITSESVKFTMAVHLVITSVSKNKLSSSIQITL